MAAKAPVPQRVTARTCRVCGGLYRVDENYKGRHCPDCAWELASTDAAIVAFRERRAVATLALSKPAADRADTSRANAAYAAWKAPLAWILDEYAELAALYAERKAAGHAPKRLTPLQQPLGREVMQAA